MENRRITIPALGTDRIIGDLYNARKDKFITGSVFSCGLLRCLSTTTDHLEHGPLAFQNVSSEPFRLLNISKGILVNLLTGTLPIHPCYKKYLASSNETSLRRDILITSRKKKSKIEYGKICCGWRFISSDAMDENVTHILAKIKYGVSFIVSFEFKNIIGASRIEFEGLMEKAVAEFKKLLDGETYQGSTINEFPKYQDNAASEVLEISPTSIRIFSIDHPEGVNKESLFAVIDYVKEDNTCVPLELVFYEKSDPLFQDNSSPHASSPQMMDYNLNESDIAALYSDIYHRNQSLTELVMLIRVMPEPCVTDEVRDSEKFLTNFQRRLESMQQKIEEIIEFACAENQGKVLDISPIIDDFISSDWSPEKARGFLKAQEPLERKMRWFKQLLKDGVKKFTVASNDEYYVLVLKNFYGSKQIWESIYTHIIKLISGKNHVYYRVEYEENETPYVEHFNGGNLVSIYTPEVQKTRGELTPNTSSATGQISPTMLKQDSDHPDQLDTGISQVKSNTPVGSQKYTELDKTPGYTQDRSNGNTENPDGSSPPTDFRQSPLMMTEEIEQNHEKAYKTAHKEGYPPCSETSLSAGVLSSQETPKKQEEVLKVTGGSPDLITFESNEPLDSSCEHILSNDFLKPDEDRTLILLGETGVGKSTFINAFANYLSYCTLEDALNSDPVIPIKNEITTAKEISEKTSDGCSQTQSCNSYEFPWNDTFVRIIDTPGFNDTRGMDQDKKNVTEVIQYVSQYSSIHGICVLLKPNESRMTIGLRSCLQEILSQFHLSACRNIVFVFTNSRSTFYRPGDTFSVLVNFLEELSENVPVVKEIQLTSERYYCLDNEAFKFLLTAKDMRDFDDADLQSFRRSWTKSAAESKRMVEYLEKLDPHVMKSSFNTSRTKALIHMLSPVLAKSTLELQKKILKLEENRLSSYGTKLCVGETPNRLEEEQEFITRIRSEFHWFLKLNSLTWNSDETTEDLKIIIRNENMKQSLLPDSQQERLLARLADVERDYDANLMKAATQSGRIMKGIFFCGDIKEVVDDLCNLGECGGLISSVTI